MRLIVAITGSSGVIYGIKTLEVLRDLKLESYLIMSEWGKRNIMIETDKSIDYVKSLASKFYSNDNMAAAISSGSFRTDGMVIIPCSMKTLSSIANGYEDSLISRAAGVCIKESRKLVIVPRETPLSRIHLENMLKLSQTKDYG
jgi:4-hydroxy-3-polyprenylbenzoate decarboxylase